MVKYFYIHACMTMVIIYIFLTTRTELKKQLYSNKKDAGTNKKVIYKLIKSTVSKYKHSAVRLKKYNLIQIIYLNIKMNENLQIQ